MVNHVANLVHLYDQTNHHHLSTNDRTILVRAYRQAIAARRSSLQRLNPSLIHDLHLTSHDKLIINHHDNKYDNYLHQYRSKILCELDTLCKAFVTLIDDILLPLATNNASIAACLTLRADQFRYIAEEQRYTTFIHHHQNINYSYQNIINIDNIKHITSSIEQEVAMQSYCNAIAVAHVLPSIHPARLAASFNLALLCAHVLNSPSSAINIAGKVLDDAKKMLTKKVTHCDGLMNGTVEQQQNNDEKEKKEWEDALPIIDAIQDYVESWKTDVEAASEQKKDTTRSKKMQRGKDGTESDLLTSTITTNTSNTSTTSTSTSRRDTSNSTSVTSAISSSGRDNSESLVHKHKHD